MASFLKLDVHFAKYLGRSLKATNLPPTWIILQAQKYQIAMASFLKIDVHFAKYPLPEDNHSWFWLSGMWD
jgi:hypothetical protein